MESVDEGSNAVLDVFFLGMHPITSIYYKPTERDEMDGGRWGQARDEIDDQVLLLR